MWIKDLMELNASNGGKFFNEETMAFFQSRVESEWTINGYFITSEIGPFGRPPRAYTIRRGCAVTGQVANASEFQEYKNLADARAALEEMVVEDGERLAALTGPRRRKAGKTPVDPPQG